MILFFDLLHPRDPPDPETTPRKSIYPRFLPDLRFYIEQMGTGTTDLIDRCVQHGLPRPIFTLEDDFLLTIYRRTPQDTPQVIRVYRAVGDGELTKQEIMKILSLDDRENFRFNYLQPALASGLIVMTIPDKPTSRNQKYRKTKLGKEIQL